MPDATTDLMLTLGAQSYFLVSIWKPVLLLAPFVAWAYYISTMLDKHAARFFLGQEKWNAIHMGFGVAALALILLIPIGGIAGFAGAFLGTIIILGADVMIFVSITNKDIRVPETHKISFNAADASAKREARKAARQIGSSELVIVDASKNTLAAPPKESPELAVRIGAEQVVITGFATHASQIDIVPTSESSYTASMLVDGVRQAGEPMPAADAIKIIDFWKATAGLDTSDRRRKLTGHVSVSSDEMNDTKIKIVSSGTKGGMKLTMIFNPALAVRRAPKDLGLLDNQLKMLKSWVKEPDLHGGVVLTGIPNDNGRTTTGYSLLRLHDAYTSNIQTIEYEVEDTLEGIKQIVWEPTDDETDFATVVRSSLRRDPDIVYICDLPDTDTAANIANADLERTRVYLSIRSEDPLQVIQTYVKAVGDAKLAADGLRGVVVGKLVRVLCGNCKVPYPPSADMLKKLGLPSDKVSELYKKGGQVLVKNKPDTCSVCAGVGYQGQTGCYGVFPIEKEERELIVEGNWNGLRAAIRKRGLPSLQQSALRKAVMGITSIEEVTRITSPKKSSSSSSKRAPAKQK